MDRSDWAAIIGRISPASADDLDALTARYDPRSAVPGGDLFPELDAVLMPLVRLKRADAVCVGFAVSAELSDAADRAMRLAAMALERDVEVIVLASGDVSGLERFGFRTERVAGDSEAARAACEEQIRRFWSLDLIL